MGTVTHNKDSSSKETLDFAEGKEMLVRGVCGHYIRADGESKKDCVNVMYAGWS